MNPLLVLCTVYTIHTWILQLSAVGGGLIHGGTAAILDILWSAIPALKIFISLIVSSSRIGNNFGRFQYKATSCYPLITTIEGHLLLDLIE